MSSKRSHRSRPTAFAPIGIVVPSTCAAVTRPVHHANEEAPR